MKPDFSRHTLLFMSTLSLSLLTASCSVGTARSSDPLDRVVVIETTACGDASKTTGSGVVIDDGRILTAAHVVIGAATVVAISMDSTDATEVYQSSISYLDPVRDLAILRVDGLSAETVELTELPAAAAVKIVGGVSGSIEAEVRRRVLINIEEVRGNKIVQREGYELDAQITAGDSGSGVYDSEGRLAAIVFAEPTEREAITFAVGATEIAAVIASPQADYRCDVDRSRVVEVAS